MPTYLVLLLAIVSEVVATAALKQSAGFTRFAPSVLVVLGYGAAFYCLSLSLKTMPIGVVYAIWSGLGTAGTVAVGVIVWQEKLNLWGVIGLILIVLGVVALNIVSELPQM